jgi:hypothetical protein
LAATEEAVKMSACKLKLSVKDMIKFGNRSFNRLLIINDKIVSSGRVLETQAIADLIAQNQ